MGFKKTLRYTQCFKVIEEELTWDKFIKLLNERMEFWFNYGNETIDIAFHFENGKIIYELNINGEDPRYYTFDTVNELVCFKGFDNKSLYEIWDELEN